METLLVSIGIAVLVLVFMVATYFLPLTVSYVVAIIHLIEFGVAGYFGVTGYYLVINRAWMLFVVYGGIGILFFEVFRKLKKYKKKKQSSSPDQ